MMVYLAGASAEVELCEWYRDRLLAAGVEIAHNWMASVRSDPERRDNEIPIKDRRRIAASCANAVAGADVFWLMVPQDPSVHVTIGAWVELGIAFGSARTSIIVSGPWCTIFADLSDRFTEHDHALDHIVSLKKECA